MASAGTKAIAPVFTRQLCRPTAPALNTGRPLRPFRLDYPYRPVIESYNLVERFVKSLYGVHLYTPNAWIFTIFARWGKIVLKCAVCQQLAFCYNAPRLALIRHENSRALYAGLESNTGRITGSRPFAATSGNFQADVAAD